MRRQKEHLAFVQSYVTDDGVFIGMNKTYAKNKVELRRWKNGEKQPVVIVNRVGTKVES